MSDPRITSGDPLSGYTSAPPPGAGGIAVAPSDAPIAGRWELSGWWRRVWAQVIDGIVIGLIALVFFLIIGAIVGGGFLVGDTTGYIAAVLGFLAWGICILVAALLYAPLMMAKTNGKTLGRMALGIRVVRANGQAITFGYATLREIVVKWLLFNVIGGAFTFGLAPLIDDLWPLWDEEHRALHDMVVDSRVIRD